ncbi:hypothetical protein, partial [Chitinophaga sp.]|uniref:hypothetical protein n=1 Tax=Chitinophaga sp. TaxID=1869181 RepID=UPI002608A0E3
RVARQRSAKPRTAVRIRSVPLLKPAFMAGFAFTARPAQYRKANLNLYQSIQIACTRKYLPSTPKPAIGSLHVKLLDALLSHINFQIAKKQVLINSE